MSKQSDFIRDYFRQQGIKLTDIAEKCDISISNLSNLFSGRRAIGSTSAKVLSENYGFRVPYLLYGEEPPFPPKHTTPQARTIQAEESTGQLVPLLPIYAQGGMLNDFVTSTRSFECERILSPIKGVDLAISISGDSMSPDYPSGCKVLTKLINEKAFIEWGRVYVLDTCNGSVIKRLMPSEDENRLRCESINPAYPAFEIDRKDVYRIFRVLLVLAEK